MMKTALQGPVPRWATAILMSLCVFLLSRMVAQNDAVARVSNENQRNLAVTQLAVSKNSEAINKNVVAIEKSIQSIEKIDQIARLLEQRLVRLETKEEWMNK